jgi:NADH-quinone oxidoreductase subunit B
MAAAVDTTQLNWMTTRVDAALSWARKFSIFQYPFVTACCGMEYMATAASHYDMDRFGAGFPRFSPRQADVLFVVGTVSHKIAPVLRRVYDQMAEPKWVVAFGVCTCTGGFYDNYATVAGIDTIIPVDIYVPGCPPRPENVLDGLMKLQEKIQQGARATLPQGPAGLRPEPRSYRSGAPEDGQPGSAVGPGGRPEEFHLPHRPDAHL